jgi:hypothetical protein
MLLTRKAFFLGGGGDVPIVDQCGGAVVVEG